MIKRLKILKALFIGDDITGYSITGANLRIKTELPPLTFRKEIRALINLRYVAPTGDGSYQITKKGVIYLKESGVGDSPDEENKELFK